jgi:hypothetical protein
MIYTEELLLSRTAQSDDCLIWQGAKAGKGYAVSSDDRERYVHRLMLMLKLGAPLGKGEQSAHRCGRIDCINPEHLYVADQAQNEADKRTHGTYRHGKPGTSHCGRYLTPGIGPKSKRCKGIAGHEGPCKPDIFTATYEAVSE